MGSATGTAGAFLEPLEKRIFNNVTGAQEMEKVL